MSQLVRLQLNGESAGPIRAQVVVSGGERESSSMGELPSPEQVLTLYQDWRATYLALGGLDSGLGGSDRAIVAVSAGEHAGAIGQYASDPKACERKAKRFRQAMNHWLRASEFVTVRESLVGAFNRDAQTRFVICTDNPQLQQLPWVLWDLMALYPEIEVAISAQSYRGRPPELAFPIEDDLVRVLAILGDSTDINVQADRQFLSELPSAEVTFLPVPRRSELHDELWDRPVDILFFAGHSYSQDSTGTLQINADEALSLEAMQHALDRIARHGLTLAIFNSCDGLGLAKYLSQAILPLGIPYIIVMREAVPDAVAQAFLKHFLAAFSRGEAFHTAVRTARERLENTAESLPPYGEWMPIIWQNPLVEPPVWPTRFPTSRSAISSVRRGLLTSLAVGVGVVGLRFLGALQGWELGAYDWIIRARPADPVDPTMLVVTVTEDELNQDELSSISDRDLEQLLERLYADGASIVGLDIIRDRAVSPGLEKYFADGDRFITICKVAAAGRNEAEIEPSPQAAVGGLSFADVSIDKDRTSRRHLLGMSSQPGKCSAGYALSTLLAYNYLKGLDSANELGDGKRDRYLTWGARRVPLLKKHDGGYHNKDMRGETLLLNYRMPVDQRPFRQVTLTQVLEGEVPPDWIENKLVLIGVDAVSMRDPIRTPFRNDTGSHLEIPGVVYHAHLTSQLVDGVQGTRRFLRPLSRLADGVLILIWAGVGWIVVWRLGRDRYRIGGVAIATGALVFVYYAGFVWLGIWLPLVPCVVSLVSAASLYKIVENFDMTLLGENR